MAVTRTAESFQKLQSELVSLSLKLLQPLLLMLMADVLSECAVILCIPAKTQASFGCLALYRSILTADDRSWKTRDDNTLEVADAHCRPVNALSDVNILCLVHRVCVSYVHVSVKKLSQTFSSSPRVRSRRSNSRGIQQQSIGQTSEAAAVAGSWS